jgi:8-oxo-dGTP diphosphatase
MENYCLGFCFDNPSKHVVLISKEKPEWQKGKINGVGGKIKKEETPLQAMIREFGEEAGVVVHDWRHCITLIEQDLKWCMYIFRTHLLLDFMRVYIQSMTEEKVGIYVVNKLPENVIPNLRWIIPMLTDKLHTPISIIDTGQL